MADEVKILGYDSSGFTLLTEAVRQLLNSFPGLKGKEILFEELSESSGIAFSADNGALVISEKRSITDHVKQNCRYPFFVVYRTAGTREFEKLRAGEFLDKLGRWLCKEPIQLGEDVHQLRSYPDLTGGRKISSVTRNNPYGTVPKENGVQDWLLPVTVNYSNEFDMW